MATIYKSKKEAIRLLEKRIEELPQYTLAHIKVWKSNTVLDLTEIFGSMSKQKMDIDHIEFTTPFSGSKQEVFQKGVVEARGMLIGYIEFINHHIPDPVVVQPRNFELEFKQQQETALELKAKLLRYDNSWSKVNQQLLEKDNEINRLQNKTKTLQNHVLQTEGINGLKLWKLVINLPGKLQRTLFGIIVGIGITGHYIYKLYELITK